MMFLVTIIAICMCIAPLATNTINHSPETPNKPTSPFDPTLVLCYWTATFLLLYRIRGRLDYQALLPPKTVAINSDEETEGEELVVTPSNEISQSSEPVASPLEDIDGDATRPESPSSTVPSVTTTSSTPTTPSPTETVILPPTDTSPTEIASPPSPTSSSVASPSAPSSAPATTTPSTPCTPAPAPSPPPSPKKSKKTVKLDRNDDDNNDNDDSRAAAKKGGRPVTNKNGGRPAASDQPAAPKEPKERAPPKTHAVAPAPLLKDDSSSNEMSGKKSSKKKKNLSKKLSQNKSLKPQADKEHDDQTDGDQSPPTKRKNRQRAAKKPAAFGDQPTNNDLSAVALSCADGPVTEDIPATKTKVKKGAAKKTVAEAAATNEAWASKAATNEVGTSKSAVNVAGTSRAATNETAGTSKAPAKVVGKSKAATNEAGPSKATAKVAGASRATANETGTSKATAKVAGTSKAATNEAGPSKTASKVAGTTKAAANEAGPSAVKAARVGTDCPAARVAGTNRGPAKRTGTDRLSSETTAIREPETQSVPATANRNSCQRELLSNYSNFEVFRLLEPYTLPRDQLYENEIPVATETAGQAVYYRPFVQRPPKRLDPSCKEFKRDARTRSEDAQTPGPLTPLTCVRCGTFYDKHQVAATGEESAICKYHYGKCHATDTNVVGSPLEWTCCRGTPNAVGCTDGDVHVWNGYVSGHNEPTAGFVNVRTAARDKGRSSAAAYCVDCEMCFTADGLEVTKVTLVDVNGAVVYDTLVLPERPIVDYNTRFSGITAERFATEPSKRLADVQRDLLRYIGPDTVIVGHGVGTDLLMLRLIHEKVIDTTALYPHPNGESKQSLKSLSDRLLKRDIQRGGHDSVEDARAAMELTLLKLRTDIEMSNQDGWKLMQAQLAEVERNRNVFFRPSSRPQSVGS